MTQLFARSCKLVVGSSATAKTVLEFNAKNSQGSDVSGLDFSFSVEKTLKAEPNTLDLDVYGLSEKTRRTWEGSQKLTVQLDVGYGTELSNLWLAEVRSAWSERDEAETITHLESGDGEKQHQSSRINLSYGAKVPLQDALQNLVKSLGVGGGNTRQAVNQFVVDFSKSLSSGTLTGSVSQRLTDFCRSNDLEWSIQDQAIQILPRGGLKNNLAFLMNSDTGMVGSPTVDSQGILSAQCLMIPNLVPGSLVVMDGEFIKGSYRVERCKYSGSTFSTDWTISFEGRKYASQPGTPPAFVNAQ